MTTPTIPAPNPVAADPNLSLPPPVPDNVLPAWLLASSPKAKAIQDWLKTNTPPNLTLLMDLYKVLGLQFMHDHGPTPEGIRQTTPILRTLINHEQHLSRHDHRDRALKIKEAEHQLKVSKAAQEQADLKEAQAFEASQPSQAEQIAIMRKLYFKEVDEIPLHYDVVLPDENNPIGRIYEKVPGHNPCGFTITPREPEATNPQPSSPQQPQTQPQPLSQSQPQPQPNPKLQPNPQPQPPPKPAPKPMRPMRPFATRRRRRNRDNYFY